ncbi:MAG: carbohydrate ABC transporter permease [Geminicoccaceae bacterium]|nr:carbohydrate ABC transporter permease [Geminicoccaceae bacterium]
MATGGGRRHAQAKFVVYLLLILFALYFLVPLVVVVFNAFRELDDINRVGVLGLPTTTSLEAWSTAWGSMCIGGTCEGISIYFWNSIKMAVPATIISTILGALNGYVLSLWRFKGSDLLFGIITLGVFMPAQMALLPWAITLGSLGLTNTTSGLVLLHVVQGVAFTTLFCRNYYVNIPVDLMKAARIDGAGFWRIFHRIVLPLSPPILIVTVIWQFTGIWNEFLFAVVFSSGSQQPVTAALIALSTGDTGVRYYNVESAAVLMAAAPPLLVYLFGGKYFMRGLTQGAVK